MQKMNENETQERVEEQEVELRVEELEEMIAPKLSANHNETFVSDVS